MSLLQVERLVFDYPGRRALDRVSFDIEAGGITALVGPNGAGKTTLMRCIAALQSPLSGTIRLSGQDISSAPRESHRRVGYLADLFGLYDDLTLGQSLRYRAAAQGLPAKVRAAAIQNAAQRVKLADRLDQKVGTLSRGMRQRLAIAQAIVHQPLFLLLDEPASGLDPEARRDLSDLLLALMAEGMTILVSSHILAELSDYSTHMLILDNGRIVEHRAIREDDRDGTSAARFRIDLAKPDQRLLAILTQEPGVSDVVGDETLARFEFEGDREASWDLLRTLIEAGLPVCSFSPQRESLQDAYLRRLHNRDVDAARGPEG